MLGGEVCIGCDSFLPYPSHLMGLSSYDYEGECGASDGRRSYDRFL